MNEGARSSPTQQNVDEMEEGDKEQPRPAGLDEDKRLLDKDRDYKAACRRYARMRARTVK